MGSRKQRVQHKRLMKKSPRMKVKGRQPCCRIDTGRWKALTGCLQKKRWNRQIIRCVDLTEKSFRSFEEIWGWISSDNHIKSKTGQLCICNEGEGLQDRTKSLYSI